MGGDCVQDERAKNRIRTRQDFCVTRAAIAIVQAGVVGQVGLAEVADGDVGLSANAVPAFEHPRPFASFEILRLLLQRGLRRRSVAAAVQAEAIPPRMLAARLCGATALKQAHTETPRSRSTNATTSALAIRTAYS